MLKGDRGHRVLRKGTLGKRGMCCSEHAVSMRGGLRASTLNVGLTHVQYMHVSRAGGERQGR